MTTHAHSKNPRGKPPAAEPPDIRERGGLIDGKPQLLDRRLFMQLLAFENVIDTAPLIETLAKSGIGGVLYADLNNPRAVALLTFSEEEDHFVTTVRDLVNDGPFAKLDLIPEYSMFGRTYALGYEPQLEDWLLNKPRRNVLDPESPWAVWYPLRRRGEFSKLPAEEQRKILREHGTIGRAYGEAGLARDVRLACHATDKNDNDFIIGLIGKRLNPLSKLVERMRKTTQTALYMEAMGPFFTGKAIWRSESAK